MTALKQLIRLHGWALDEKRRKLAELEGLLAKMRGDLEQLDAQLTTEGTAASQSMAGTIAFPAFVVAELERRKKLMRTIASLDASVLAARDELADAYLELKSIETAKEKQDSREHAKRSKHEQLRLDEVALGLYRRRSGEDGA